MKKNKADDQQPPKVIITKHKKPQHQQKKTTISQISERRLSTSKRGQLENNKYEDKKVLGQNEEDKDS